MTANMDDLFRQAVRRAPEHPAILGPQSQAVLTYRVLDEAIADASDRLRSAGVRRGDCVGLHLPSSVPYIVWNYAVWRCGGCVVPIPVELAADEKSEIFRQIAIDFLITPRKTAALSEPYRRAESKDLSADLALVPIGSPQQRPSGFAGIDGAFIRFTSGTTGSSKGVVLSHRTIEERVLAANEALRIGPADRIVWVLSMSYHFTVSIVGYLTLGATIVLPANHFAAAIFQAIGQHQATILYASPMHFALLADSPQAAAHGSLRLAISTTSSLDSCAAEAFGQRCGLPICQALGVIEIGLPCINVDFAAQSPGSVGRVLPAYEVRLDDVGLGPEMREILFRGPGFLDAYYHPWQTREQILEDGWFRTGDVGRLDENGCLHLAGRSTDVINVMGMKFFPQEVERVLASHPGVQAAVVFSQKGGRYGETAHARVIANHGAGSDDLACELRQFCSQRLASYKVPERIELVQSLPRTASGKVLHRVT
jgi:long-chain acyl-CoA synthetase